MTLGDPTPDLDRPVPEEFRQVAIERAEMLWGPLRVIDDGYVAQLKATGQHVDAMRKRLAAHKVDPKPFVPSTPIEAVMQAFGHYPEEAMDMAWCWYGARRGSCVTRVPLRA